MTHCWQKVDLWQTSKLEFGLRHRSVTEPVVASKTITNSRMVCLKRPVNGTNNLAQEMQLLEHRTSSYSGTGTNALHSAGSESHWKRGTSARFSAVLLHVRFFTAEKTSTGTQVNLKVF